MRWIRRTSTLAVALAIVLATPLVAAGVVLATQLFVPLPAMIPEPEELEAIQFSQVYDVNRELIHTYQQFDQNIPVTPGDIPEVLKQAVIAAEDRNFYGHSGVDIRGTMRALVTDVREGELAQGGSTITQQLAKNAYGVGSDRTITPQGPRGRARRPAGPVAEQGADPLRVPVDRVLRRGRLRHRRRRRRVLRQAGEQPERLRGRHPGRPHPGAVAVQPPLRSRHRGDPAQERAAGDARRGLHHPGGVAGRGGLAAVAPERTARPPGPTRW